MPRLSWRFLLVLLVLTFVSQAAAQETVRWQSDLEGAKREALRSNRLILVHYWATWCPACYRMENEVFSHPSVAAAINEKFVPVKLNFDHYQVDARAMGVTILPTDIVLSPSGQVVKKLPGFVKPSEYVALLANIGGQPGVDNQTASTPQSPPAADYLGDRYANYRSGNLGLAQSTQPTTQYAARPPVVQQRLARPPVAQPPFAQQQRVARQPVARQPVVQQPAGQAALATNQTLGPRYGNPQVRPQAQPAGQPPVVGNAYQAAMNPPAGARTLPGQYSSTPLQASQIQPTQTQLARPAVGPPIAKAATGPAPPKFGLDGFCPVSLLEDKAWKFGDRRWGATHLGVTYLFTSLQQQQKFLKTPDRYSPVGLGNDIVVLLESGKTIPGQRKHGVSFAGRIYLFSSQQSLDAFTKQPRHYIDNFSRMIQASRQQYGQNVR